MSFVQPPPPKEELEAEDKKERTLSQIILSSQETKRIIEEQKVTKKDPVSPISDKKLEDLKDNQAFISIRDLPDFSEYKEETPRERKDPSPTASVTDTNNESMMPMRSRSAYNRMKISFADDGKSESGKSTQSRKKGETVNKKENSQYLIENPDFGVKAKPAGKDKGCFSGLMYLLFLQ